MGVVWIQKQYKQGSGTLNRFIHQYLVVFDRQGHFQEDRKSQMAKNNLAIAACGTGEYILRWMPVYWLVSESRFVISEWAEVWSEQEKKWKNYWDHGERPEQTVTEPPFPQGMAPDVP